MVGATLSVTIPEFVWIGEVSRAFPAATFEVFAAVPGDGTGFALVRIYGDDIDGILESMDAHEHIVESTDLERTDVGATVHFETVAPLLLLTSQAAGVPIEHPVVIQDGTAELIVSGAYDRLSGFVEQLDQHGFSFTVEYAGRHDTDDELLTTRQRTVLTTAVELGYYETPRRITLTELADELDVAKSTASECLHRAESAVIAAFVDDLVASRMPMATNVPSV